MRDSAVIDKMTWIQDSLGSAHTDAAYFGSEGITALVKAEMPVFGERTVFVGGELAQTWSQGVRRNLPDRVYNDEVMTAQGFERGPVGPWMTFRATKGKSPALHVGILPWILGNPKDHPMFAGLREPDGQPGAWDQVDARLATLVLARMSSWEQMMGLPWRGIPGVMGTALLRSIHSGAKRQPLWHHTIPIQAAEREITGWSAPKDGPAWGPVIRHPIMIDAVQAYLGSAGTVEVADSKLERTGRIMFDPGRPGWWKIDAADWRHPHLLPDPLMCAASPRHAMWVSTSTLKFWDRLTEAGDADGYVILDSLTADKGVRLMRIWAERINLALRERAAHLQTRQREDSHAIPSMDPLSLTLKAMYRQALGLMNHEGSAIYRSDWHYGNIAGFRNVFWHKMWRAGKDTGMWPVKIATDAAIYNGQTPTSTDPKDSATRLILGTRLGQFQIKPLKTRVSTK